MGRILTSIESIIRRMLIFLMGFLLLWVFALVLTRYFFGYTPSFGEELARYIYVWLVFLGLPVVARGVGHMAVEFVTVRVKGAVLRMITILSDLFTSVFLVIMIVGGLEMVVSMSFQTSAALQISMSYVYSVIPFGCAVMLLNTLTHLVNVIRAPTAGMK